VIRGDPVRLLVLAPFAPRRDASHGGSRAMAELLVRLAERHSVALLALRAPGEPPVDGALVARCDVVREIERRVPAGLAGKLRTGLALARGAPRWVTRWRVPPFAAAVRTAAATWRPDVVQLEYHLMGQYLADLDRCPAPRILRQLEPGAAAARDGLTRTRGLRRAAAWLDLRAWRAYERRVMNEVQCVVALTEQDEARLLPLAGRTPIERIPLGIAIPSGAPVLSARQEPLVLFVGNFIHPPNIEAADRLVGRIFPRVLESAPEARCYLVGPQPPRRLIESPGPGVVVAGEVPDLAPLLARAAVVVAPLALGGGMRVKVAEALAAGKAVVATRLAVEGLAVRDGLHLCIADEDEAFAAAIVRLLANASARDAMALRARAWAEAHLGWEEPVAEFERLYARLTTAGGPRGGSG
jgi:polysaccharide biosynthesis protein PslH